jgi:hypothetical protein
LSGRPDDKNIITNKFADLIYCKIATFIGHNIPEESQLTYRPVNHFCLTNNYAARAEDGLADYKANKDKKNIWSMYKPVLCASSSDLRRDISGKS